MAAIPPIPSADFGYPIPPPSLTLLARKMMSYGHSFQRLGGGPRVTALVGAHAAGAGSIAIRTGTATDPGNDAWVEAGETWEIRDAAVNKTEYVTVQQCADMTSSTPRPLLSPLIYAHADGTVVQDPSVLWGWRLAGMLGAQYFNRAVAGAALLIAGAPGSAQAGGVTAVNQRHPTGSQQALSPNSEAGLMTCLWGVNDASAANIASAGESALVAAWKLAVRFVLSRSQCALVFDCSTPFPAGAINTSFGGGGWAVVGGPAGPVRTFNQGNGYNATANNNATVTHTLPVGWGTTGTTRIVTMCMVGKNVGGAIPSSQWSFTLDGQPITPIGYEATPFTTVNVNPNIVGVGPLPVVARFRVPVTGVAQTLVATTGVGGGAIDWIGFEADYPMPTAFGLHPNTPGAVAETTSCLQAFNAATRAVRAEFSTPWIALPDLWTAMSPGGVCNPIYWTPAVDNTHPNSLGNNAIAGVFWNALGSLGLNIYERASM